MMNLSQIDFDGARILKAQRDKSNISITLKLCGDTNSIEITFYSITEENSKFFIDKQESILNTSFPPLDVIETFKDSDGKYEFGGYLNNEPWAVWGFKAKNYVIS